MHIDLFSTPQTMIFLFQERNKTFFKKNFLKQFRYGQQWRQKSALYSMADRASLKPMVGPVVRTCSLRRMSHFIISATKPKTPKGINSECVLFEGTGQTSSRRSIISSSLCSVYFEESSYSTRRDIAIELGNRAKLNCDATPAIDTAKETTTHTTTIREQVIIKIAKLA